MSYKIHTIILDLPMRMGKVNCYLVEVDGGYLLIDTGNSARRKVLISAMPALGCTPGNLHLILLTHGDFDHCGNTAFLRDAFSAPIALHPEDASMVERGDMFANRRKPNLIFAMLLPLLSGFGKEERFAPDILLTDGQDLAEFGLEAQVISLPGHSRGSIGILTREGDLFCGDLFTNIDKPALNTLMDRPDDAVKSMERLQSMKVKNVFPGHGEAFAWERVDRYLPG